jgi:hypothetical protein
MIRVCGHRRLHQTRRQGMTFAPIVAPSASGIERTKRIRPDMKVTDGAPAFCEREILDDRA